MFFNGFTLLLMMISLGAGVWLGIRIESAYQYKLRNNWLDGETIESQMAKDGWRL
jgi:hypothetical protein